MALSTAARQARYRERQAHVQAQAVAESSTILATLETLTRAVEALAGEVRALRNDGGRTARSGGKPPRSGAKPPENGAARYVTDPAGASRARLGGDATTPLRGDGGGVTDDDAHTVLVALTRPGSAGAIRDALGAIDRDLSLDRITTALVALQGRGLVTRTPGDGPAPDVWAAVEDPALEDLAGPVRHAPGPDPQASAHIDCQAYSAHATLGHRWDPVASAFRCYVCHPEGRPDHAALAYPTRQGGAPSPQATEVH